MKYVLYAIAVIIGFFLFIPESGSTEIRNVPLLILIVSLIIRSFLIRFFKHVALMRKTEKLLRQNGVKSVQTTFFPWDSRFRGRYSMRIKVFRSRFCADKGNINDTILIKLIN